MEALVCLFVILIAFGAVGIFFCFFDFCWTKIEERRSLKAFNEFNRYRKNREWFRQLQKDLEIEE